MDKYVKKPVTIRAMQFPMHDPISLLSDHTKIDHTGVVGAIGDFFHWMSQVANGSTVNQRFEIVDAHDHAKGVPTQELVITDHQGNKLVVNPGDWVISGVRGELYPCTDSIFKETYISEAEHIANQPHLATKDGAGFTGTIREGYETKSLDIPAHTCKYQFEDRKGTTQVAYQFRVLPDSPTLHNQWAVSHSELTNQLVNAAIKSKQYLTISPDRIGVNDDVSTTFADDGDYILVVDDRLIVMPREHFDSLFTKQVFVR